MVEGLLLLVVILVGVYVIFVYWNRQSNLYAKQRDIISQVTHELKSPLASIQLHLETIRLRRPAGDKLDAFVGTMLSDTDRLHYLINNLLMAARLEQRRKPAERRLTDIQRHAGGICRAGTGQPAPGGQHLAGGGAGAQGCWSTRKRWAWCCATCSKMPCSIHPEARRSSYGSSRSGNSVRLTIQDKGRGLDRKELKKVFEMFYRVHPAGENVRGTGLGLYIVDTIIRSYGGKVSVESAGLGQGCTFIITLPAV